MDKLIYLASPYSSPFRETIQRRIRQAQDATARLIERGHLIFSPIVHSHPLAELVSFEAQNDSNNLSDWMRYDKAFIDKADELWVLELEGVSDSLGVEAEYRHALQTGKTVRFISYPELRETGYIQGFDEIGNETCEIGIPGCDCVKETAKQQIIGLHGVARSGKDTTGQYLVDNHGFTRIGLADAVRDALYDLDPVVYGKVMPDRVVITRLQQYVDAYGWDEAKEHKLVREYLQKLGTEVGRDFFGENCWIDIAREKIAEAYPNPVVITDIRFENEADFIHEIGGEVWQVIRPGTEAVNAHVSETQITYTKIDAVVPNNGTIRDLNNSIENLIQGVITNDAA